MQIQQQQVIFTFLFRPLCVMHRFSAGLTQNEIREKSDASDEGPSHHTPTWSIDTYLTSLFLTSLFLCAYPEADTDEWVEALDSTSGDIYYYNKMSMLPLPCRKIPLGTCISSNCPLPFLISKNKRDSLGRSSTI